ncbi:hypothetical protein FRC02_006994 [Tulasnella sp. 418]|nr:hypothetical protein FRC02_006994 [Tulasnella sp. 418]
MLAFINTFAAFILLLPAVLAGPLVPRRDTPNFYLVATSTSADYHLKHLGIANQYDGILTTGTASKFYLEGQRLRLDINDPSAWFATVDFIQVSSGSCSVDGPIKIIPGTSSNKCAKNFNFNLSSYEQNSQLGAKLVFNWAGGFYGCSGGVVRISSFVQLTNNELMGRLN